MEQQSGPGGWTNRLAQPAPKPGQMRLWTYQSIAHGADMVLYFRWRTATMGTEIYWHGINDYHNRPNRRIREAAQIGREIEAIGARVAGTRSTARNGLTPFIRKLGKTPASVTNPTNGWPTADSVWKINLDLPLRLKGRTTRLAFQALRNDSEKHAESIRQMPRKRA